MQIGTSAVATLAATLPTAVAAPDVTVLTSDETHGKMVIGQRDGNDLDSRKKHSFCFQGLQAGTGQHRYLPVVVARDATTGKRILLISGVLGAEVSRAGGTSLCRDFSL